MHSRVALLRRWWQVSACGLSQWSPSGRGSHPACSHNEGGSRTNPWWHTLGDSTVTKVFKDCLIKSCRNLLDGCKSTGLRQAANLRKWNPYIFSKSLRGISYICTPTRKRCTLLGLGKTSQVLQWRIGNCRGSICVPVQAMAMERLKHLWHCWTRVLPSNSKTVTQDTLSQHNPLQKVALQTQREFDHPSNSYIHLTYFVICVVLTVCLQKGLFWKGPHLVVYYVCAPTVRRRFPNLHQDCLPPKHIVSIAPTRCLFT